MLRVRLAGPADAGRLVLRQEDLDEARLYGEDPEEGLRRSIEESFKAHAALDEHGVVALWGISNQGTHLSPWLMCSARARAHPRALLGFGRALVADLRRSPLPAWNMVGKSSAGNKRFLRRLGFRIEPLRNPSFDRFFLP